MLAVGFQPTEPGHFKKRVAERRSKSMGRAGLRPRNSIVAPRPKFLRIAFPWIEIHGYNRAVTP